MENVDAKKDNFSKKVQKSQFFSYFAAKKLKSHAKTQKKEEKIAEIPTRYPLHAKLSAIRCTLYAKLSAIRSTLNYPLSAVLGTPYGERCTHLRIHPLPSVFHPHFLYCQLPH